MTTSGSKIERRSLAEEVAQRLRHDILSGRYGPGERIVVPTLEERYGVSHIPIREAFRSLENEALIVSRRGSGAVVAAVSLGELHDIYDLRRLLEVDVLRTAIALYDDVILEEAQAAFEAVHGLAPTTHDELWWPAHRRFHMSLLRPGLTPWSERVLRLLWQSVERYQRLYTLVFGSVEQADREHRELLNIARERDEERLVAAWLTHLNEKEQRVREGLLAQADPSQDGGV